MKNYPDIDEIRNAARLRRTLNDNSACIDTAKAFRLAQIAGGDIYAGIASKLFNRKYEDCLDNTGKQYRAAAKDLCLHGMSAIDRHKDLGDLGALAVLSFPYTPYDEIDEDQTEEDAIINSVTFITQLYWWLRMEYLFDEHDLFEEVAVNI